VRSAVQRRARSSQGSYTAGVSLIAAASPTPQPRPRAQQVQRHQQHEEHPDLAEAQVAAGRGRDQQRGDGERQPEPEHHRCQPHPGQGDEGGERGPGPQRLRRTQRQSVQWAGQQRGERRVGEGHVVRRPERVHLRPVGPARAVVDEEVLHPRRGPFEQQRHDRQQRGEGRQAPRPGGAPGPGEPADQAPGHRHDRLNRECCVHGRGEGTDQQDAERPAGYHVGGPVRPEVDPRGADEQSRAGCREQGEGGHPAGAGPAALGVQRQQRHRSQPPPDGGAQHMPGREGGSVDEVGACRGRAGARQAGEQQHPTNLCGCQQQQRCEGEHRAPSTSDMQAGHQARAGPGRPRPPSPARWRRGRGAPRARCAASRPAAAEPGRARAARRGR